MPAADPLNLEDPALFRTIRGVAILDAVDASGLDAASVAAASNDRVASGRPPRIQLGHTPAGADHLPESSLPPVVGFLSQVAVAADGGLLADLHYYPGSFEEALTSPRISTEVSAPDDPGDPAGPHVAAVCLLKGIPGEGLGPGPRAARIHYGKELPAPSIPEHRTRPRVTREDVQTSYRVAGELGIHPVTAYARLMAGRLRTKAGRVLYASEPLPTPAPASARRGPDRGLAEFASRHGIRDPAEARLRYDAARRSGGSG